MRNIDRKLASGSWWPASSAFARVDYSALGRSTLVVRCCAGLVSLTTSLWNFFCRMLRVGIEQQTAAHDHSNSSRVVANSAARLRGFSARYFHLVVMNMQTAACLARIANVFRSERRRAYSIAKTLVRTAHCGRCVNSPTAPSGNGFYNNCFANEFAPVSPKKI